MLDEAGQRGMNFSQHVNSLSPETIIEHDRSAVDRLMMDYGFFTRSSDIALASPVTDFLGDNNDNPHGQVLLADLMFRAYNGRRANGQRDSIITGVEDKVGSILYPGTGSEPRFEKQVAPPINIGELVAMENTIPGTTYRPFRFESGEDALARTPIAPGSEIPATTIGQKEGIIQLNKWANRFRITYEAIREFNVRIDKLASWFRERDCLKRIE